MSGEGRPGLGLVKWSGAARKHEEKCLLKCWGSLWKSRKVKLMERWD